MVNFLIPSFLRIIPSYNAQPKSGIAERIIRRDFGHVQAAKVTRLTMRWKDGEKTFPSEEDALALSPKTATTTIEKLVFGKFAVSVFASALLGVDGRKDCDKNDELLEGDGG